MESMPIGWPRWAIRSISTIWPRPISNCPPPCRPSIRASFFVRRPWPTPVPFPGLKGSADAVLLMGPLYHLPEKEDRLAALQEARRLLKPGGKLFAAAITRLATLLWAVTAYGEQNDLLEEEAFCEMIRRELEDGQHIPPDNSAYRGMSRSFFHEPEELAGELMQAGFQDADVRGILGSAWLAPHFSEAWREEKRKAALLSVARLTERDPSLLSLSTHLLAVAAKPAVPKKQFAFLLMGEQYDPARHLARFETSRQVTSIYTVRSLKEAESLVKRLEAEGVGAIELCGAFGEAGAAELTRLTGGRIAVGYVTHAPEMTSLVEAFFTDF